MMWFAGGALLVGGRSAAAPKLVRVELRDSSPFGCAGLRQVRRFWGECGERAVPGLVMIKLPCFAVVSQTAANRGRFPLTVTDQKDQALTALPLVRA